MPVWRHESAHWEWVVDNGDQAVGLFSEQLEHHPIEPSDASRPSPGWITVSGGRLARPGIARKVRERQAVRKKPAWHRLPGGRRKVLQLDAAGVGPSWRIVGVQQSGSDGVVSCRNGAKGAFRSAREAMPLLTCAFVAKRRKCCQAGAAGTMEGERMLTQETEWIRGRKRLEREVITPQGIAERLEHRLHWPYVDADQLMQGCEYAAEAGLGAVLCRPEHVRAAARHVGGTATGAVTALAFHDTTHKPHRPADLATEAAELVSVGATEVALIVAPGFAHGDCLNLLKEQVCAVVEVVTSEGAGLRVLLDTTGVTNPQVSSYTGVAGRAGVCLIQGGSFRGDRATFSQIETMRDALPGTVLLKWTQPVRSVEMMLVSMALGVDRFNGDIPTLLSAAKRSSELGPLMLPVHGVDF